MKTINKLKLTKLSKVELEAREMNILRGGTDADSTCNCNCASANSLHDTHKANAGYGYQYSYGGDGTYTGKSSCECLGFSVMQDARSYFP